MNLESRVALLESAATAQTERLRAIENVCEANQMQLAQLIEESRGVLEMYSDLQGAARAGVRLQRFLAWVAKWPLIGGGVYLVIEYLSKLPK